MAKKRRKWVDFLKCRERMSKLHVKKSLKNKEKTISQLKSTNFDFDFLYNRIRNYSKSNYSTN